MTTGSSTYITGTNIQNVQKYHVSSACQYIIYCTLHEIHSTEKGKISYAIFPKFATQCRILEKDKLFMDKGIEKESTNYYNILNKH